VVSDTGVPEAVEPVDPVIPEDPVEAVISVVELVESVISVVELVDPVISVVELVDPALAPLSEPAVGTVAPSAEVSGSLTTELVVGAPAGEVGSLGAGVPGSPELALPPDTVPLVPLDTVPLDTVDSPEPPDPLEPDSGVEAVEPPVEAAEAPEDGVSDGGVTPRKAIWSWATFAGSAIWSWAMNWSGIPQGRVSVVDDPVPPAPPLGGTPPSPDDSATTLPRNRYPASD